MASPMLRAKAFVLLTLSRQVNPWFTPESILLADSSNSSVKPERHLA
jgi:hypothetical protein